MLSGGEVTALRGWVADAETWSEAAQGLVGAASTLATGSCDLADLLDGDGESLNGDGSDRFELARQLRLLADKVETETADLRGHFLAMSADIEQYRSLTG